MGLFTLRSKASKAKSTKTQLLVSTSLRETEAQESTSTFTTPEPQPQIQTQTQTQITHHPNTSTSNLSTTSTLISISPHPNTTRPPPPTQSTSYEAFLSHARETEAQRQAKLEKEERMVRAWIAAQERRTVQRRSWPHDPWRGGFGPRVVDSVDARMEAVVLVPRGERVRESGR